MILYSLGLTLAAALSVPVWGWRMLRQGRYRQGLWERLGAVPQRLTSWIAGQPVVWVHAVSVGEAVAASRLIAELEAALPGFAIVVSTTTPTGQHVARERFGVDRVFFYPLDFAFAVRPFLRALRPRLVILMESELWPRMLVECERGAVPVAVVNARVSDRSFPRYMALRALWRPLLRRVSLLLAQSETDVQRWTQIGAVADRVQNIGNLKYDIRTASETPLTTLVRNHLLDGAKVLVCGSTHEGEEALLLDCWKTLAVDPRIMILAPRHPQRVDVVLQLAKDRGLTAVRLSVWRLAPSPILEGTVLLVDTVGELASLYALATVAFVGGSLVSHGGQNPLEPAQFGVPVVMGHSYENFRAVVDGMKQTEALALVNDTQLCTALQFQMLTTDDSTGRNARAFYESQAGATGRAVAALIALMQERQP